MNNDHVSDDCAEEGDEERVTRSRTRRGGKAPVQRDEGSSSTPDYVFSAGNVTVPAGAPLPSFAELLARDSSLGALITRFSLPRASDPPRGVIPRSGLGGG